MIPRDALDAIRRGRRGVHVTHDGRPFEARAVQWIGGRPWIQTYHLNGSPADWVPADDLEALERTYEEAPDNH